MEKKLQLLYIYIYTQGSGFRVRGTSVSRFIMGRSGVMVWLIEVLAHSLTPKVVS